MSSIIRKVKNTSSSVESHRKSIFLSSALPYSLDTSLTDIHFLVRVLTLLNYFLTRVSTAMNAFYLHSELDQFDPHVGDSLCQVRAAKLSLLYKRYLDLPIDLHPLQAQVAFLKQRVEQLLEKYAALRFAKKNLREEACPPSTTIQEFLAAHHLDLLIPSDVYFLFLSYVLGVVSGVDAKRFIGAEAKGSIFVDHSKLQLGVGISKAIKHRIIRRFQRQLSNMSTEFMWELFNGDSSIGLPSSILQALLREDEGSRAVFPCFLVMEQLFAAALAESIPILVSVQLRGGEFPKYVYMLFINEFGRFVYKQDYLNYKDQACLVIHGIALSENHSVDRGAYVQAFNQLGLREAVMANMASHPQYSGSLLNIWKKDPYRKVCEGYLDEHPKVAAFLNRFQAAKYRSHQVGCSEHSPEFFLVRHIFSGIVGRQVQEIMSCHSYDAGSFAGQTFDAAMLAEAATTEICS